jgi:hypothetical protein
MGARSTLLIPLLAGVGLATCPERLPAQVSFAFTRIADASTSVPGGTGTFAFFGDPAIDGTSVAFLGQGGGRTGIYAFVAGGLVVAADTLTTMPGTAARFAAFGFPSVAGPSVAFYGESADRAERGIYTGAADGLVAVATQDDAVPGTSPPVLFSGFGSRLSLDDETVAFVGEHGGVVAGIYSNAGGGLSVVADTSTPIPSPEPAGTFTGFSFPSIDHDVVAFVGEGGGGRKGIYTRGTVLSDLDTAIPGAGASGTFTDVAHPSTDRLNVAFVGLGTDGQWGVYGYESGVLGAVADTATAIPGAADRFINFQTASMDFGNVAFVAQNSLGQPGLYLRYAGTLHKVVDLNDTLDGRQLAWISIGAEALSGGRVAFSVVFDDDGTQAIYLATLNGDRDGDLLPDDVESASCTDPDSPDTDADGIPDGVEDADLSGSTETGETDPCDEDTDGDALPDGWENLGVDADANTTIDLDLPAMGADPLHKDVFVEIDFMDCSAAGGDCAPGDTHAHEPKTEALEKVVAAFADAPVDNPDGTPGIHLHVDAGASGIMDPVTAAPWGSLSEASAVPHVEALDGTASPFDLTTFMAIKSVNFAAERDGVFHYCLFAHTFGGGVSGAALAPGADLIVSLGRFEESVWEQAGTFMHELGHNLGLAHGGDQGHGREFNFKPNYLSVMNYRFQMRGLLIDSNEGHFDYSRFGPAEMADLDELALDEAAGLSAAPALDRYGTTWSCGGLQFLDGNFTYSVTGPINWNCNYDPAWPDFEPETGVAEDVNFWIGVFGEDFSDQILTSSNDWAALAFDGVSNGLGFGRGPAEPPSFDELTREVYDTLPAPYAVAVSGAGRVFLGAGASDALLFTVTNVGETRDTYLLSGSSSRGWAAFDGAPAEISLGPGEAAIVSVHVFVPDAAIPGEEERTKLVARSASNPELLDSHVVTTAVALVLDTDDDGFPDTADACPTSDRAATIVIGDCDAGVDNHLLADGCTILDRIGACADGARKRGRFVSCVSKLTNGLYKEGILDRQQKGKIRACAASTPIPAP